MLENRAALPYHGSTWRDFVFSPNDASYPFADNLEARLDQTQENIEAAIRLGRQTGLDVYVATYFPIREGTSLCDAVPLDVLFPPQAVLANEYLDLLNERIRQAADEEGAVLVDIAAVGTSIAADLDNYADCNHLSATGNEIVAEIFFNAITAHEG